jgi:hypothetical protein
MYMARESSERVVDSCYMFVIEVLRAPLAAFVFTHPSHGELRLLSCGCKRRAAFSLLLTDPSH